MRIAHILAHGLLIVVLSSLAWWFLTSVSQYWTIGLRPMVEGTVIALEPGRFTTLTELDTGNTRFLFHHAYEATVPRRAFVNAAPLAMPLAVWFGLSLGLPGIGRRRRAIAIGVAIPVWFVLASLWVSVHVQYQYALFDQEPFASTFGGVRGWSAYFAHMVLMEIGGVLFPIVVALGLYSQSLISWARGSGRRRPDPHS